MKFNQTPGQALAEAILATIDNGGFGVTNPYQWPTDAVYAVEYTYHDRQFPEVKDSTYHEFFTSLDDFEAWKAEKLEFVKGTDGDFIIRGRLYEWDWGPQYKDAICIQY